MTKGLPWTVEEETQLKKLIQAKTPLEIIASTMGKTSSAVQVKCQRLGIVTTDYAATANLPIPAELPSVEDALRKLAGDLEAASAPGLSKVEVQRRQVIAGIARAYKEILADCLQYREVEAKLNDMKQDTPGYLKTKYSAMSLAYLYIPSTIAPTTGTVSEKKFEQNPTLNAL
jgi:hypothetical protein